MLNDNWYLLFTFMDSVKRVLGKHMAQHIYNMHIMGKILQWQASNMT